MKHYETLARKNDKNGERGGEELDIYTYTCFAYALTAVIAFITVGIMQLINKVVSRK